MLKLTDCMLLLVLIFSPYITQANVFFSTHAVVPLFLDLHNFC